VIAISLLTVFISWVACMLIVRHALEHARNYGHGQPQRFHLGDVPRLGGAGVAAGWFAGVGLFGVGWGHAELANIPLTANASIWLTLTLIPLVGLGLMEDMTQRVRPSARLLITLIWACLVMWLMDIRISRLDWAWFDLHVNSPLLWGGLTLAALTGLPHAFNIIDGYNGLAGMVSLVVALALAHIAIQVGDREVAMWLVVLAAANTGFLAWNYPRGLIFAGDGGAYLWGGVIAIASITLVQRHEEVSPWFPMLLLIYPVWETIFSIYRKLIRGVSPGVADALHFHQLIYRRIVREVFHDDEARRMLMRNNRTSPYLWGFTLLTVIPAVLFWRNTPVLMGFCLLFVCTYVPAYLMIVRFKVPRWIRRGRGR
jgi:UDP-GlcNAc:undecaprenyl-phosphate GlcNAc-1-phosphate transferase